MNRFALGTVAIAALGLMATGCQASVHAGNGGPTSSAPTAGTTIGPSGGTGGSTPGGAGTGSGAHPTAGAGGTTLARCHSSGLHAVVTGYNAGAGSRFAKLLFTNVSGHACRARGWPGLGLGTASEGFGGATVRQGTPTSFVIIPGGHAYTMLRWSAVPAADENQGGNCEAVATVVQVIPPDETAPLAVHWQGGAACQHNQLTTTPLTPGPGA